MKTFRTLFLVIAILSGLNIASIAEEPSKPLNSETTLHKSSSTKIPKSVIPEVMECYYEYGILCFDVDIDMTNVSVVITDIYNNISQQYYLNTAEDYINVELTSGVYHIIFSSNQASYEGILSII